MNRISTIVQKGAVKAPFFVHRLGRCLDAVGGLLFPISCPSCDRFLASREDWPLCAECRLQIEALEARMWLSGDDDAETAQGESCSRSPALAIRSAARYAGPVRDAIIAAKFNGREDIVDLLGIPLLACAAGFKNELTHSVVVPLPLHRNRLLARGFNLPDRLSQCISRRMGLPYRPLWLERRIDTESQVGKSAGERRENVADAFLCPNPENLQGRKILLIDDVVTSGATMLAAAKPFFDAGAEVLGLSLAQA